MITQALRHFRGIGSVRLSQLHEVGIHSWQDVLDRADQLPPTLRPAMVDDAQRALRALTQRDIAFFVETLNVQDRWRILTEYFDELSFFDIETSGLEIDAAVTVIVCWHRQKLHTFVEHENLDDFLDLLDEVSLLVSFNGSGFDVPRVLDTFHIPQLPCPHLDLRWPGYHAGLTGGLKAIEQNLRIARPDDLHETDGSLAIRLWDDWQTRGDQEARCDLIRYCAADVLSLILLSQHLSGITRHRPEQLWSKLPEGSSSRRSERRVDHSTLVADLFGSASPSKLRTRAAARRTDNRPDAR